MVSVIQDISDQKAAQAALHESEVRFKTLADNISQLAWMADANGGIFWFNRRWYDYTGADLEQAQGWGWQKLHHPHHVQRVSERIMACFAAGENWEDTFPLRGKDGGYRWFLSRAIPVKDADGRVLRWFGTNTDVTEQRLAEETLRRTEKLSVVGRMALSISHEINNPLAAVMNLLYLIAGDKDLSKSTREFVSSAERELKRVSHVVTQTLRFAKPSEQPERVDLREIADSILDLFRVRFDAAGLVVVRQYGGEAALSGYADELRQLIANLVGNAHDAMRGGGRLVVRIREVSSALSREESSPGERGVRLTIADNGTGIPQSLKGRIFEPFITTKQETGTGLGLWISSKIVEKHNGRMRLRSSTDPRHHGSVFSLFFPSG